MESYRSLERPPDKAESPECVHERNKLGGISRVLDIVGGVVEKPSAFPKIETRERHTDPLLSGHRKELRRTGKIELSLRHFQLKYQRELGGKPNPAPWSISMHGISPDKEAVTLTALRTRFSKRGIAMVPLEQNGSFSLVHVSTVQSQKDLFGG